MSYKLLAVAAMSLSLGATSALAQTAGTTGTAATGTAATGTAATAGMHGRMPAQWEGAIGDAFYEDTERGTLRADEDEIRVGWDDLDDDDRQAVRDYCEQYAMDTEALDHDGAQAGQTGATGQVTGQAGTTGTTGQAGATGATGQAGAAADAAAGVDAMTHQASLRRICEMVEDWNDA